MIRISSMTEDFILFVVDNLLPATLSYSIVYPLEVVFRYPYPQLKVRKIAHIYLIRNQINE